VFIAGDIIQKIFRKFPLLPLNLAQEPCSNATYLLENGWSCSLELAISARVEFNTVLKSCVHQVFIRFLSLRGTQKLWHIFPTSPCQWHLFRHFYPLPVFQLHIGLYISGKDIKVYKINTSKVPFAQLKKSCRLPFTAPCFYLFIYLILNSKAALILLAVMWACEGLWSYFPADLKSSAESHSPGHISSIFRTPDPFCKRDQALLVPTCSYLHLLALECMVLEKGFQKRSWLPYTACPL